MSKNGKIYLDYNATTPLAPEVLESISVALRDCWGNPSNSHAVGVKARNCITEARASVARMINVHPSDIIFTSGGTESNCMVLHSIASLTSDSVPHVIISNLEHASINLTAKKLEELGRIELTVVNADPKTGKVCPEDIISALHPSSRLVSLMLANNETGVIQPLKEVVKAVKMWDKKRGNEKMQMLVHTDASQALGKIPVDASELGVDFLTVAGHKFYGPRFGALLVKGLDSMTVPFVPIMYGGGQERGYRPGTENTGMIAGLGKAAELVADNVMTYEEHMRTIRDYLEQQLEGCFEGRVNFNAKYDGSERIPNTCSFSIIGIPFQGLKVIANLKHCLTSIGAACHASTPRASPVLIACGVPEEIALNALRISVGRGTTKADIDVFVKDLKEAVDVLEQQ